MDIDYIRSMSKNNNNLIRFNRRTHISRFFIVPSRNGFYGGGDVMPTFDKVNGIHLFSAFQDENSQLFFEGNYAVNEFYLNQAHDWNGDILLYYPIWQGNNLIARINESLGDFTQGLQSKEQRVGNEYYISPITQQWVEQVGQMPNVILSNAITRLDVLLFIGGNILGIIPKSEVNQLSEHGWTDKMNKYISKTLAFIIDGKWKISCDLTFPDVVNERHFKEIEEVFI
jgi:hypothetical protein